MKLSQLSQIIFLMVTSVRANISQGEDVSRMENNMVSKWILPPPAFKRIARCSFPCREFLACKKKEISRWWNNSFPEEFNVEEKAEKNNSHKAHGSASPIWSPLDCQWEAKAVVRTLSNYCFSSAGITQKYSVPLRSVSTKDKLSILGFLILKKYEVLF